MAGIDIRITVTGLDEIQRSYASSPALVKEARLGFLRKSRNLVLRNVRANIPVRRTRLQAPVKSNRKWYRPGTTRRSVRSRLSTAQGRTTIFSRWFVARFLERGTRKMSAQQPFERAARASQGDIQRFANEMAVEIARKLERPA